MLPVKNRMRKLFLMFLFSFRMASPRKHSLQYSFSEIYGIPYLPEFHADAMVDEVQLVYCNSNVARNEFHQDWVKELFKLIEEDEPKHLELYESWCKIIRQTADSDELKLPLNQTEGVQTLQWMRGCEWDDETEEITGFIKYRYDGEDFIELNMQTQTWIALTPEATPIKVNMNTEKDQIQFLKDFYTHRCPEMLKKYLHYGKRFLQRTEVSSLALLQKTPSSPITCYTTGFYPDIAVMFWRKDGEELDKDVEYGDILPNHDGTFQMSVHLNLSAVTTDDWGKYDCVFQLSGVPDDFVIQLDKQVIKTNWVPPPKFPSGPVIGVVVGLLLLLIVIAGVFIYRRHNNGFQLANRNDRDAVPDSL